MIDIGSNSVRLVVYDQPGRAPLALFNEKVMVGLGRRRDRQGTLTAAAIADALAVIRRFASLCRAMEVGEVLAVATAAVREAPNGSLLLDRVHRLGIRVRLLSGTDEARLAALGVISAIPGATGVVGDLGGGSLELARVAAGKVRECASFPLGVLRLAELRATQGPQAIHQAIGAVVAANPWLRQCRDQTLYLVGGSWRALARFDMQRRRLPLPVVHHYAVESGRARELASRLVRSTLRKRDAGPWLPTRRIPHLPDAARILAALDDHLGPSELVVSAYGLREGLLFEQLDSKTRARDPLLEAARAEGEVQGRFAGHGELLDRWIAPLFTDDLGPERRVRRAACLLADTGWRAHPAFRAERGLEMGLHGNWVGLSAAGRAQLAQALFTSFGGRGTAPALRKLCSKKALARAMRWGLAMRLGQRLSGGAAAPLRWSSLALTDRTLDLRLAARHADLYGEPVERRHRQLATALRLRARRVIG